MVANYTNKMFFVNILLNKMELFNFVIMSILTDLVENSLIDSKNIRWYIVYSNLNQEEVKKGKCEYIFVFYKDKK